MTGHPTLVLIGDFYAVFTGTAPLLLIKAGLLHIQYLKDYLHEQALKSMLVRVFHSINPRTSILKIVRHLLRRDISLGDINSLQNSIPLLNLLLPLLQCGPFC